MSPWLCSGFAMSFTKVMLACRHFHPVPSDDGSREEAKSPVQIQPAQSLLYAVQAQVLGTLTLHVLGNLPPVRGRHSQRSAQTIDQGLCRLHSLNMAAKSLVPLNISNFGNPNSGNHKVGSSEHECVKGKTH